MFVCVSLAPGTYDITITKAGLKTLKFAAVTLTVDQALTLEQLQTRTQLGGTDRDGGRGHERGPLTQPIRKSATWWMKSKLPRFP